MAQDTPHPQETTTPDEHIETAKAERQERLSQLLLRRSKLSADEAALLREHFPTICASHHKLVWNGQTEDSGGQTEDSGGQKEDSGGQKEDNGG